MTEVSIDRMMAHVPRCAYEDVQGITSMVIVGSYKNDVLVYLLDDGFYLLTDHPPLGDDAE